MNILHADDDERNDIKDLSDCPGRSNNERWLAALSIGPGIFEIVCMLYIIFIMSVVYS